MKRYVVNATSQHMKQDLWRHPHKICQLASHAIRQNMTTPFISNTMQRNYVNNTPLQWNKVLVEEADAEEIVIGSVQELDNTLDLATASDEDTHKVLSRMRREELIDLAIANELIKSKYTKITTVNLRERIMRHKVFGEQPLVATRTIPAVVPKEAQTVKRWGHRFMLDHKEVNRWPQAQFFASNWRTSPKKLTQTLDFIRHMSVREAMDQLLLNRTRNNYLTFRFLRRNLKQCENNWGWDENDVFIKEAFVIKRKYRKKIRHHAQGRYGIQHYRKVGLIMTLAEWQRDYKHEKISKFGWRPETWVNFDEQYISNLEYIQGISKDEMLRQLAFEERLEKEKEKELEGFEDHFKKARLELDNNRNLDFAAIREEVTNRNKQKAKLTGATQKKKRKGHPIFGKMSNEKEVTERVQEAKTRMDDYLHENNKVFAMDNAKEQKKLEALRLKRRLKRKRRKENIKKRKEKRLKLQQQQQQE